jgi:hypothetical protein
MLPPSFSLHEIYSKHRNPDEIREIERQNRVAEARAYEFGDPVNTQEQFAPEQPAVIEPVHNHRLHLRALILRHIHLHLIG